MYRAGYNQKKHYSVELLDPLGILPPQNKTAVVLCRKMTRRIRFGMEPDVLKLGLATSPAKALLPGSPQLLSFCWGSLTTKKLVYNWAVANVHSENWGRFLPILRVAHFSKGLVRNHQL